MVATRRNNPDVFEQPLTLTVAGEQKVFTSTEGVVDYLRKLERVAIHLHLEEAKAVFNLGQALQQAKERLGYGQVNHLYNECGLNRKRAQRSIRFAKFLADEDGTFSIEKFRMWERKVLDMREAGELECAVDTDGTPTVTAMQVGMGIRTNPKPKSAETAERDPRVPTSDVAPYRSPADALANLAPTPPAPVVSPPRGAGGGQLVLDFDLLATQHRLAHAVEQIQAAMERGALSSEQGSRVNDSLERVCSDAQDILEHAKG